MIGPLHRSALAVLILAIRISLNNSATINILSVLDTAAIDMCMVKIHSVVESSHDRSSLHFGFLVLTRHDSDVLDGRIHECLPNISYVIKVFEEIQDPLADELRLILRTLPNKSFEKPIIYVRTILPNLFTEMDRFLYLDNDIVGNIDVSTIYETTLALSGNEKTHSGFVWDVHKLAGMYLSHHFNFSHPVVRRIYQDGYMSKNDLFNSGVWLCDALLWRKLNNSYVVVNLMARNIKEKFCVNCGDQEFIMLAFSRSGMHRLPSYFNYRRIMKHSVDNLKRHPGTIYCELYIVFASPLLSSNPFYRPPIILLILTLIGFIHFAGSQKNENICGNMRHIHFRTSGAMHVLLSAVYSLPGQCYARFPKSQKAHCKEVLETLQNDTKINFVYNPIFNQLAPGL